MIFVRSGRTFSPSTNASTFRSASAWSSPYRCSKPHKRISLAGNHGKVFVCELAPLKLDLLTDHGPIAFYLIPLHLRVSWLRFFERCIAHTCLRSAWMIDTRTKKPVLRNTNRSSTTPVYFLTSPLDLPGCHSFSHPKDAQKSFIVALLSHSHHTLSDLTKQDAATCESEQMDGLRAETSHESGHRSRETRSSRIISMPAIPL